MATSVNWREKLNKHPLAQELRRNNTNDNLNKQQTDARSLVCIYGSDLYVWDAGKRQILHCNLKSLLHSERVHARTCASISDLGTTDAKEDTDKYQKLLIKDGFTLDVEAISINRCGSYLLLWGAHGIQVVELPRRWGKNGVFEGGKEKITARTVSVGERTFTSNHSVHIRQVTWHPGSQTDSHLAVLTSDNMFSIYDIQQPDQPLSITVISAGDVSQASSPGRSLVATALGETCVAFDFGPSTSLQPKQKLLQASSKTGPIEVWPVYCVRGCGEVMLVYSSISEFSKVRLPVQGPLMMYPPAEDNYGVDACSILCLPTPFPVVIISTCEGRVHHCVQLPGTLDAESVQSDTSISSQHSASMTSLYEPLPEPVLYVIETAELELCLTMPRFEGESSIEDDFMCPVQLKKDTCSPDRYHCVHTAGVHSVALPWLSMVEQYFLDEPGDFSMPEEKECVVEHLVCTKPLFSCPTSPVLGLEVISDPLLGATLLILSSDYEFTALAMGLQYRLGFSQKTSDAETNAQLLSPLRRQSQEPFSRQVEQILQKRTSNPLLRSGSGSGLSQQECFQLLSRATQVLREEYIQRQDHARQELDTRIDMLREHKELQLLDLKRLIDSRLMLREHAHSMAELLETVKDNHENLLKRLESILRKLQSRMPVLSEAERQMAKELDRIKDNTKLYTSSIEQVRGKQKYQDRMINKPSSTDAPTLQKKQLTQIYDVLKDEGEDIEKLKNDLNRLSIGLI